VLDVVLLDELELAAGSFVVEPVELEDPSPEPVEVLAVELLLDEPDEDRLSFL
jgi:hypothetical protein